MEGEGGRAEGAHKKLTLDHTNTEGDAAREAFKTLVLAVVLPQKEAVLKATLGKAAEQQLAALRLKISGYGTVADRVGRRVQVNDD
jgi:hypothetical protein